ncbi:MAG: NUDIX hydrolase [Candidatus Shapirobacteria bacterium]|jgi:8-oxo-dGTP pyrophosphatase MutT (NUDIX family)
MITCNFEDGNKAYLRHGVVDVLVLKGNQILLEKRNKKLLEGGKWALVGGYIERDETLIGAVKRETLEETGYQIDDIKLLKIIDNPNRPGEDRQNIAFLFVCQAGEKVGKSDWEVDDLQWFDLDKLPSKELIAFDHWQSIQFYIDSLKSPQLIL